MASCRRAVKQFQSELTEHDAFAPGLVHNTTCWFSKTPRNADADLVKEAFRFLDTQKDSEGIDLGVALDQALGLGRKEGERARRAADQSCVGMGNDGGGFFAENGNSWYDEFRLLRFPRNDKIGSLRGALATSQSQNRNSYTIQLN